MIRESFSLLMVSDIIRTNFFNLQWSTVDQHVLRCGEDVMRNNWRCLTPNGITKHSTRSAA